jgi:hypothetical protein
LKVDCASNFSAVEVSPSVVSYSQKHTRNTSGTQLVVVYISVAVPTLLMATSYTSWSSAAPHASAKGPSFDTYVDFTALTPRVQSHLQKVYATLACSLLLVALGSYAHICFNLGGTLSLLATLGTVVYLAATPATAVNEALRLRLLLGIAFFQGCSIGPLVQYVADMDSR